MSASSEPSMPFLWAREYCVGLAFTLGQSQPAIRIPGIVSGLRKLAPQSLSNEGLMMHFDLRGNLANRSSVGVND